MDREQLDRGIARTRDFLLERQHADGHWVAELEGDSILESEYLLLLAFLGQGQTVRAREAAACLVTQQQPHGGWSMFPGGPIEISGSVKAYLALKIAGYDPRSEFMIRARDAIVAAGGVEKVNSFTRFYLAMLGLIPYSVCPAVPPELILLPTWAPFNIYEMSAWSRTIIVPLSLLWACQPCTKLPPEHGIDELYASPQRRMPAEIRGVNNSDEGFFNWSAFFRQVDRGLKLVESLSLKPLRARALKLCERWILDRLVDSDGLGAIFPPIIWTIIGLRCLGYADDHPVIMDQFAELEKLVIRENEQVHLQPCLSPVWDTAIATIALRDAGVPMDHPAMKSSVSWLLDKEVRCAGDWTKSHPDVEPGGWFFEYRNKFYPDVDDTAMVLIALSRCLPVGQDDGFKLEWNRQHGTETLTMTGRSTNAAAALQDVDDCQRMLMAMRRGANWLKAMQSRDGGWGAFDSDNTREVFTKVPFADHNAMIDPSTADITARVLEAFASAGVSPDANWQQNALRFVFDDQLDDGAWFGRWGVNYLYGTWQVLQGLVRYGIQPQDARLQRGADWLVAHQQSCGGWGETAESYDDPNLRGTGTPTASQTAWAVLGLIAAGRAHTEAAARGIAFLLQTQQSDGSWIETEFTGTGFPRVFYLRYHYYRIYFPLMALARFRAATMASPS